MERELDDIIRASPARIVPDLWFVLRVPDVQPTLTNDDLAICHDATETTLITSDEDRVEKARAEGVPIVGPFRAIRFKVSLPFQAPGFIAAAAQASADDGISVYVVSTFSYDYFLVRAEDLDIATTALRRRGFEVVSS